MGFILYSITRDFMVVPSEQNVFVASQLGVSPPISLTLALNFAENGPRCLLSCFAFYIVMYFLCCSMSFSLLPNIVF